MRNKLIAEAIGTYFLYLIIGICITPPTVGDFTPLAVAIGLTALVYSCGHISKAHFNPATTVTYLSAGTHSLREFLPYILVIYLAASAAAGTVYFLFAQALTEVIAAKPNLMHALMAEGLFTLALMWVILNVAIAKKTAGNAYYGIAIGAIVGAGAYAVGPISSAAFNPAVTLALCLNGFLAWDYLLPYSITQILAAAGAGFLFRSMQITNPEELSAEKGLFRP
ncbi:MAG: Aquaporin Z [Opitutia bacterium UBA7350]|nr:MAG: Aquaporin Z [Opitutae bacterium UBA7350]